MNSYRLMVPVFALCLITLIGGCDSSSRLVNPSPANAFPNTVGLRWTYAVYDSLAQSLDTVIVEITHREVMVETGEMAAVWLYSSPDPTYFRYVVFSGDTVTIYSNSRCPRCYGNMEKFPFPLRVGDSWNNTDPLYDTSLVVSVDTIEVPAGQFVATRVDRVYGIGFEGGGVWTSAWLTNNVGITQLTIRETITDGGSPGPPWLIKNEVWELISFDQR